MQSTKGNGAPYCHKTGGGSFKMYSAPAANFHPARHCCVRVVRQWSVCMTVHLWLAFATFINIFGKNYYFSQNEPGIILVKKEKLSKVKFMKYFGVIVLAIWHSIYSCFLVFPALEIQNLAMWKHKNTKNFGAPARPRWGAYRDPQKPPTAFSLATLGRLASLRSTAPPYLK